MTRDRPDLPRGVRPIGRHPDPHLRRHRPRRGRGPGGFAVALRQWPATACRPTPAAGSRPPPATARSTTSAASRADANSSGRRGRARTTPHGRGGRARAGRPLRLIFTCCHPALPTEAQIALDPAPARWPDDGRGGAAFLVAEPTMAKRLSGPSTRSRPPTSPIGSRPRRNYQSASARSWPSST